MLKIQVQLFRTQVKHIQKQKFLMDALRHSLDLVGSFYSYFNFFGHHYQCDMHLIIENKFCHSTSHVTKIT